MTYRIEPSEDEASVRITFDGDVVLHDVLAALSDLSDDGAFRYAHRLWDLRGCDAHLRGEDFRRIGEMGRRLERSPGRVVILVDRDVNYGIFRIQQVYRESPDTEFRVVRDEAEALVWLRAG